MRIFRSCFWVSGVSTSVLGDLHKCRAWEIVMQSSYNAWFFSFYLFLCKNSDLGFLKTKWFESLHSTQLFITIFVPGQGLSLTESSRQMLDLEFPAKAIARAHIILHLFSDLELSTNVETLTLFPPGSQVPKPLRFLHLYCFLFMLTVTNLIQTFSLPI